MDIRNFDEVKSYRETRGMVVDTEDENGEEMVLALSDLGQTTLERATIDLVPAIRADLHMEAIFGFSRVFEAF